MGRFKSRRPPEKRKQIRQPLTVQLVAGRDDDLIEWWLSLPKGERRAEVAKTVLRVGLELPIPDPQSGIGAHELDALRNELFSEWQNWTRQLVDNLPSYVQTAVETALATAPQQPAPPPVEAAEQLDEAIAQERANKLKRASW